MSASIQETITNYTLFILQTQIKIVYLVNIFSLDYMSLLSFIISTVFKFHKAARKLHSYISELEIKLMWYFGYEIPVFRLIIG